MGLVDKVDSVNLMEIQWFVCFRRCAGFGVLCRYFVIVSVFG